MKTLTIEEAMSDLPACVDMAIAGEQIRIRKGNAVVELRPAAPQTSHSLSPREALRQLQQNARLKPEEVEAFTKELHQERLDFVRQEGLLEQVHDGCECSHPVR